METKHVHDMEAYTGGWRCRLCGFWMPVKYDYWHRVRDGV